MSNIVPDVPTLDEYLRLQEEKPEYFRPAACPNCNKTGLWCHGYYNRKADRVDGTHNPVHIPRFFCPHCRRTCSTLPECISPRRWYLWSIQQAVFALILAGKSLTAASKKVQPSRQTVSRWLEHFKGQYTSHRNILSRHIICLDCVDEFINFWLRCFKEISLSRAMYFCNGAGVRIP